MSPADAEGPPGDSDQEKSAVKNLPGLAAFATMGTTIASCLAVGVVLGLWADHVWHSAPWGLLLGIVLGTVAAVTSVIKLVRRFL
ncbi:MAG TPA: AtpZ/AtpI family protein [Acidimicrobiales bacterium]|nr:AtpZ/AtpI family protein [Acidimicrobiales bacterium]